MASSVLISMAERAAWRNQLRVAYCCTRRRAVPPQYDFLSRPEVSLCSAGDGHPQVGRFGADVYTADIVSGHSTFGGTPRDARFRQRFCCITQTRFSVGDSWTLVARHQGGLNRQSAAMSPSWTPEYHARFNSSHIRATVHMNRLASDVGSAV